MSIIQGTSKASSGSYQIDQSIRFEPGDSPGLNRAWASGSRTTATLSAWFKLGLNDTTNRMLATFGATSGTANDYILVEQLGVSKVLQVYYYNSGVVWRKSFSQVLRDPSAWYHLVVTFDTTNGTADDRVIPYLNGSRVTAFAVSSNPTASANQPFNVSGGSCYIGKEPTAAGYFDGYMAEINFVDGTALDPSSFGETNADGVWVPIEYTGAYGTNGFYITGATAADLGEDFSGNGNDFTSAGLATTDQMLDSPTNNYATLNPLDKQTYTPTFSDGNLRATGVTSGQAHSAMSTISFDVEDTEGFYFEGNWLVGNVEAANFNSFGIVPVDGDKQGTSGTIRTDDSVSYQEDGHVWSSLVDTVTYTTWGGSTSHYPVMFVKGGSVWFGLDKAVGTVTWNGDPSAGTGAAVTGLTGNYQFMSMHYSTTASMAVNFGAAGFRYTAPTGGKALNTSNLPEPTIKDGSAHFQTTLYTGNGTAIGSGGNAISQSGNSTFQPDFVWIKGRSGATEHVLTDAVRGVTKELSSNDFNAEETVAEGLTTFGSAGFTVGSDGSYNTSSATYAAWQWKANGAGSSNEDGSVSSTVSVNTTAGFSIARAAAPGNLVTFSIGHGLGITPSMVICKGLGVSLWSVYHHKISSPNDNYVRLDTTTAVVSDSGVWGTGPTSSVFSAKSGTAMTHSEDFVAYCFAEVDGFSSFGSYTGNGSANGPMVNCGFRPAFVLIKRTNATENWLMMDSTRYPNNPANNPIFADTTNADANGGRPTDFLSNGFKPRNTLAGMNASGSTYIYMAFAEHPFGGANTAPATAR